MKPGDIVLYLLGNRGAIERIAGCRWAILVGAVLVLSAGIARNWDAVYLPHDGTWILGPFGMSLFSTTFLFTFAFPRLGVAWKESEYGTFLRLFWMTAPCAWLYAIPLEQWNDPLTAAKGNVGFLVVVSLWRVGLIVRALSVLAEISFLRVLLIVLPVAAFEMFVALLFKGTMNAAMTMGGVRDLPPEDAFVDAATEVIVGVSFWTFVGVGALSWTPILSRKAQRPITRDPLPFPTAALCVAVGVLALGLAGSVPMQRRVANTDQFQRLVERRQFEDAARFAASHRPEDFPTGRLRPYRRPGFWDTSFDDYLNLFEALPADAPAWLRADWEDNLIAALLGTTWHIEQKIETVGHRHPRIDAALKARADDLRSRKRTLPREELHWLEEYARAQKTLRITADGPSSGFAGPASPGPTGPAKGSDPKR